MVWKCTFVIIGRGTVQYKTGIRSQLYHVWKGMVPGKRPWIRARVGLVYTHMIECVILICAAQVVDQSRDYQVFQTPNAKSLLNPASCNLLLNILSIFSPSQRYPNTCFIDSAIRRGRKGSYITCIYASIIIEFQVFHKYVFTGLPYHHEINIVY